MPTTDKNQCQICTNFHVCTVATLPLRWKSVHSTLMSAKGSSRAPETPCTCKSVSEFLPPSLSLPTFWKAIPFWLLRPYNSQQGEESRLLKGEEKKPFSSGFIRNKWTSIPKSNRSIFEHFWSAWSAWRMFCSVYSSHPPPPPSLVPQSR